MQPSQLAEIQHAQLVSYANALWGQDNWKIESQFLGPLGVVTFITPLKTSEAKCFEEIREIIIKTRSTREPDIIDGVVETGNSHEG